MLHVDMDAFYVSVELLRRPELRGRPVVVGGSGPRGVVAAASYEARAFGVFSAMPSTRARQLCPHAVFLAGDHATYAQVSARVMAAFGEVTPLVEPLSLDEAFLDVTSVRRLHGDGPTIARSLRDRVRAEEGLTCSVGVATSKFVAKLASKAAKPRATPEGPRPGPGVVVVAPGDERRFVQRLDVRELWGVGPATFEKLQRLGVRTVAQLAALDVDVLRSVLGDAAGRHLHELAHARDDRPVVPDAPPKSVSHEETYATDLVDLAVLRREVVRQADAVASRLRRAGLTGRTVQLKVRFGDFRTITRSTTLDVPLDTGPEIARAAKALLDRLDLAGGVRLLGVGVSGLGDDSGRQLSLIDVGAGWEDASRAVDLIRDRFGDAAIGPAAATTSQGLKLVRRGAQQWGPGDPDEGAQG
ncbi:DNA polymerase IV [Actinomarinicola tropica]|uniref:DNA polymerase IV n=1 Tax=Actinomarinicola tropica TaxID=2789776 RepID=A0A5Q2RRI7_9ACTN|nr:DNA polymerase IV [Actinomarinicola tropica]